MKKFVGAAAGAVLLEAGAAVTVGQGHGGAQIPLHLRPPDILAQPSTFTMIDVDKGVCEAGSKQWAGSVNVSEGNNLFYCELSSPESLLGSSPVFRY